MGSVLWFFFPHDKTSWADAFPHLSFFPTHCSSLLTSPCKILWGQLISEWCGLRNLLLFSLTWLFCFISDHFNPLTTTCCWCCNTLWCEMSLQWSTAPRPWGPLWWKRARSCGEEIRGCGKQNCEVQSSPRSLVKQTWEGSCDKWQRLCCCGATKPRHNLRRTVEKPDWAYQDKQATEQTKRDIFLTQTQCFLPVTFKHRCFIMYQNKHSDQAYKPQLYHTEPPPFHVPKTSTESFGPQKKPHLSVVKII